MKQFNTQKFKRFMKLLSLSLVATLLASVQLQAAEWTIDSADDWTQNIKSAEGATVAEGSVAPNEKTATISTTIHTTDLKRSAKTLVVNQSAIWKNWNPIENLGQFVGVLGGDIHVLAQPPQRDLHVNCLSTRRSFSKKCLMWWMPCRTMARRSAPTPNANPEYLDES